jgi:hypothetical protein
MKNLLKNKWVLLIIAVVVLYFVWKKYGKGTNGNGNGTNGNGNGAVTPGVAPNLTTTDLPVDEQFSRHADNH